MLPSLHIRDSLILAAACGLLASAQIQACQICLPIPKESAVDHLLAADAVVLARENPDKPFSLIAVETLKGEPDDPTIDLFLDSTTRRLLARMPDRAVVCGSGLLDDGSWRRIGITNPTLDPLVREVLSRAQEWEDDPDRRPRFFSQWLGHEDPQVRTVAHLEVARARYDQIRDLGAVLSQDEIHAFLGDFRYLEWHALYILFLPQCGDEHDHQLIAEKVRSAERFGTHLLLSAWLTAWIEVDEEAALDFTELHYLEDSKRTEEEMRAILMTLSVHGNNGHVHLRDRIVENYRRILDRHPVLAPGIVEDLTKWERWDLMESIAAMVAGADDSLDGPTRQQLRNYVNRAAQDTTQNVAKTPNRWRLVTLLAVLLLGVLTIATRAGRFNRLAGRKT